MMLEGEAFSQRLRAFSDSTMQLIMDVNGASLQIALKSDKIVANSELTEEQVVAALKELLREHKRS